NTTTGLHLTATLVFDHPTPEDLTTHLLTQLMPSARSAVDTALAGVTGLEAALASIDPDDADRVLVTQRLKTLLARWNGAGDLPTGRDDLDSATNDDLFDLIDKGFGVS
ncbi:acyl carrier protein, partial [Kitasatospora sp. NPDC008115]|uniref:acyl carrier protein n=1 Tax=Kitasatospora sp. NPDC008115 TaxID=3364022 RepID=UPI0036E3ABD5